MSHASSLLATRTPAHILRARCFWLRRFWLRSLAPGELGGRLRLGHGLCLGWSWPGLAARVLLGLGVCGLPPLAGLARHMLVQAGGAAALTQPQHPHPFGALFG